LTKSTNPAAEWTGYGYLSKVFFSGYIPSNIVSGTFLVYAAERRGIYPSNTIKTIHYYKLYIYNFAYMDYKRGDDNIGDIENIVGSPVEGENFYGRKSANNKGVLDS
jgi:hypothetical protein